jgi:large subunit ribosomal protein L28
MSKSCDLISGIRPSSGNIVSHSKIKTKRRFLPNLQVVSLKSEILNSTFSLRIAVRTMRTIAKHGGFDNFILVSKANQLTSLGLKLRQKAREKAGTEAVKLAIDSVRFKSKKPVATAAAA